MRTLLLAALAMSATARVTGAQAVSLEPSPQAAPPDRVSLPYSHEYLLRSRINGRTYRIQVALPPRYRDPATTDTTRYPVMYLLDGDMELPLFARMFRLSNSGTDSPPKWPRASCAANCHRASTMRRRRRFRCSNKWSRTPRTMA